MTAPDTRLRTAWASLAAAAYVACVVLANVLTEHLGLVPIGFGLVVTAGTFAAGGTLLARNILQTLTGWSALGRVVVVGLMLAGCGLSWWLASPQLATASGAAFALSESTDLAIFTWQRRRGWSRAVAAAGVAAGLVDTLAFLYLAGFPVTVDSVAGQLLVKVGISWLVAGSVGLIGVSRAVLREPVHVEGA